MAVNRYEDVPPLLRDFLFYLLTIRGRSQRTVDGYHVDLRCFLRYLRASRELGAIPEDGATPRIRTAGLDIQVTELLGHQVERAEVRLDRQDSAEQAVGS